MKINTRPISHNTVRQEFSFPKKSKGFTLIEVMVTVAVLAFGIVTIYEALFVSMDTFGYYSNYLDMQNWINEKIADVQAELTDGQELEEGETSGRVVRDQKMYNWNVFVSYIDGDLKLYQVRVTLAWKQGNKQIEISRSAYLLPSQLVKYEKENFV